MSYYRITVNLHDNEDNKHGSSEIYKQEVPEIDLLAIIQAVNKLYEVQRIAALDPPIVFPEDVFKKKTKEDK